MAPPVLTFMNLLLKNMNKQIVIKTITFYQLYISPPLFGSHFICRFQPTCSNYTILAIKKYGTPVGLRKGVYRILRCNSFNKKFGDDWP